MTDKPFNFEDLLIQDRKRIEPAAWGPVYDIKKRRGQSVGDAVREAQNRWWRNDPPFKSNSASGQAGEFNARKYRAQLQAAFTAQCNKDKRDWADGKLKGFAIGERDLTIEEVYERALTAKRACLSAEANAPAATAWDRMVTACQKPRYILRNGALVLAEAA